MALDRTLTKEEYYCSINEDLFSLIPKDANAILEVGCASGQLGSRYKEFNASCNYIGIEMVPDVAKKAESHLDRVITGNAEQLSNKRLAIQDESLDCVVYGDVLEHLIDPWKMVEQHAALVKKGGYMVTCIPNIRHWSVINKLLHGKWEYREDGIMDKTHLRFFTLDSIYKMFEGAGFKVQDVLGRRASNTYYPAFIEGMEQSVKHLAVNWPEFKRHTAVYQYIIRAVKS